jgi:oligopeptide transport system substrate-binding protein
VHSFNVLTDLYEGLLSLDAHGNIIAGIAESWDVSSDGLIYTFRLAGDARWSDGTPVTADHVVAGMRRTLAPETGSAYSALLYPIRNAAAIAQGNLEPASLGVTASDAKTVVIELDARAPYFPSVLTMPIAYPFKRDMGASSEQFSDPQQFVGNGPFVLEEWHPGSHIQLRKNAAFREADTVALDAVKYFAVTTPGTELNMYRAGEIDITYTVPGSQVSSLRKTHATELQIVPNLGLYYLAFDLGEAPFDNALLRKALSMAIDREALVRVTGRGEQPAYGLVPDGVNGYVPARFSWNSLSPEDRLAKARVLYRQAGYSAGNPLEVTLLYDAGDFHETIALAVSAMWREGLGAEVELDKREWQYFLATRENRDEWQVMRFAWNGDYDHPGTFTDILHSKNPQNLPGYSNATYDQLLAEAEAAVSPGDQMRLYAAAEAAMLEDDPIVPLYFYVSKHLVAPSVTGFENNVLDRHPSRYIRKIPTSSAR